MKTSLRITHIFPERLFFIANLSTNLHTKDQQKENKRRGRERNSQMGAYFKTKKGNYRLAEFCD